MKRFLFVIIFCLVMIICFAGCTTKSEKAETLIEKGQYYSALEILDEMDETELDKSMMRRCYLGIFADYIKENGTAGQYGKGLYFSDSSDEEFCIAVETDTAIKMTSHFKNDVGDITSNFIVDGSDRIPFDGNSRTSFSLLGYSYYDSFKGSGYIDISTGKTVIESFNTDSSKSGSSTNTQETLQRMIELKYSKFKNQIRTELANAGLGFEQSDLGIR